MIAALYVAEDGPYVGVDDVDAWGVTRDARKYEGPYPVVAHPPCERWGRYWSGGPSVRVPRALGDDGGCFEHALRTVRKFGGVLEHPEASHAWEHFGLARPKWREGWVRADDYGFTCCVAQGNYGHVARKLTWLYAVGCELPELDWSIPEGMKRLDVGPHSAEEARAIRAAGRSRIPRLSNREKIHTPEPFRDILINMARSVPQ